MPEKPRVDLQGMEIEGLDGHVLALHGDCAVENGFVQLLWTYRDTTSMATRPADIGRETIEGEMREIMAREDEDAELRAIVGQEV